jgi:hypothetical protein
LENSPEEQRMKNVLVSLTAVAGLLCISPLVLAQTNPSAELERAAVEAINQERGLLSQAEEALIKEQVLHVVNKYYEFAASGEVERIAAETHMIPWLILSRDEVYDSVEATTSRYAERRRTGPSNWAKSTYNARNVCVLSNSSAITSGYNVRSTIDGDIISVEGVAYVLMKTADGWRIAAFSGTSPQRVIRCEDEY